MTKNFGVNEWLVHFYRYVNLSEMKSSLRDGLIFSILRSVIVFV